MSPKYKERKVDSFCGCFVLLQIIYFHKLKFKNVCLPSSLPLIAHWSDMTVSQRLKDEESVKCFGSGILLNCFPISEKLASETEENLGEHPVQTHVEDVPYTEGLDKTDKIEF